MMTTYHLAIDIGASSGRHILGYFADGRFVTEEVYRFPNGPKPDNGTLTWDIDALEAHVKAGIRACVERGTPPATVAIDTWGVDYVLLDRDGAPIRPAVSYRDGRGAVAEREVSAFLPQEKLYGKTGIQKQPFNTIYQLFSDKQSGKLDAAAHLLMIPDYLAYCLTGVISQEYTNATTTGLVNAAEKQWDNDILAALGLPAHLFGELNPPCTPIGPLTDALQRELGLACTVVRAPSHDTASAVAACPLDDDSVYLSSGTWSLIGTEITTPVLSPEALAANFTNEGGVEYRFRFLKNIMGMWMFQNLRREMPEQMSYDDMMNLA
ncbi:MAG: rhamnulokinase, partial [Clostridia bacterium]|nr:rhamnulokinase [Clostridia bacterium]